MPVLRYKPRFLGGTIPLSTPPPQYITVVWVTRDGKVTWKTRDEQVTWKARQ